MLRSLKGIASDSAQPDSPTLRCDRAESGRGTTRPSERGSVLLLFPAAVMVMLVLAAIVLDVGLARVRFQELRAVAASAANDVAGAVDVDSLRSTGAVSFDPAAARARVDQAVAAGPLPTASVDAVAIARDSWGRWEVTVTLSLEVDLLIAPALPGAAGSIETAVSERVLIV